MFKVKRQATKRRTKKAKGPYLTFPIQPEEYIYKLVELKKYEEKKIRRFLRQLTGAPERCKVVHSQTDEYRYYIKHDAYPAYTGNPPSWTFPDFSKCKPPTWFKLPNGTRKHTPWPTPSYIPSTQKVEIGIQHLNQIKFFFKRQKKSKYKLKIENRIIALPSLALGRYLVKYHPDKSQIKIIE